MWDISNPRKPKLRTAFVCPGSQSDVSVYRNLLFVSAEATNGRVDCGIQRDTATVSGSANVRPAAELAGCSSALPAEDPASALFRIEVIQVPLAHAAAAR